MPQQFLIDTQLIIYASQQRNSALAEKLKSLNVLVTDISREESIEDFMLHIDNQKAQNVAVEIIERKYRELF